MATLAAAGNEVSRAEFARMREVNRAYITKLAKAGRIVLTDDGKRVKVQESVALLESTKAVDREGLRQHHAAQRIERAATVPMAGESGALVTTPPPSAVPPDPVSSSFNQARADKEQELAKLAKMKRQQEEGALTDKAGVIRAAQALGSLLANGLHTMRPRVVPLMAAESDPLVLDEMLRREFEILQTQIAAEMLRLFPGSAGDA